MGRGRRESSQYRQCNTIGMGRRMYYTEWGTKIQRQTVNHLGPLCTYLHCTVSFLFLTHALCISLNKQNSPDNE